MRTPEPSLEWDITSKCNYHCSYCIQKEYQLQVSEHCADPTVDAILELLPTLPGQWLIKLMGGEPMIHPRFYEVSQRIAGMGHQIGMTTNFSLPWRRIEQFLDATGDKLQYVTASLHLEQIKSLELFIEKAMAFNTHKQPTTRLLVTSVCLDENFELLKEIAQKFEDAGVKFSFQALKMDGKYLPYSNPEIEPYLKGRLTDNTENIRGMNLYGTMCHTGELFFRITVSGDVIRCYNPQPLSYLGNITEGTFEPFGKPKPCLSAQCTCTVPANRGMIMFGQQASKPELAAAQVEGWMRNFRVRLARKTSKPEPASS
jgi:organic radical activating enzyme